MVSGLNPSSENFLLNLERIQKRSQRAQNQLTSGLRLTSVSDDPDQVSRLLESRANLDRIVQTQNNLGRVKVEVDASEQALQTAVSVVERARVLGTQGGGTYQSANTRQQVANELQGQLQRLIALSGTQVEGRYVFSGDNDQVMPYDFDPNAPSGVTTFQGSASTRQIEDAQGALFGVSRNAQEIFDSDTPEKNVFLAVNNLRRALLAVDNPTNPPDPTIPSIETALANVGTAGNFLNTQLSWYGLVQNRVQEATDNSHNLELSYRNQIANIEEADLASASIELTQSKVDLDAALSAKAKTPPTSLFDFLG
jgi:flagellar hook-associated protein 3 FlgL